MSEWRLLSPAEVRYNKFPVENLTQIFTGNLFVY